ncbi:hypothetical protein D6C82_01321 [Aureobasidium pullulans]|nr:hypothetical protein D6C82_01321 [Aureobasidium pullulans]
MDRDISTSSAASTPGYIGAKRLPPWEVSDIPRVPHISSSAPPLSRAEMEALSSLWATRTPPDHSSNSQSDERFQDTAFAAPSPPSRTDTGSCLSELENDTGLKTEQKLNEFLTDRTHTDELYSTPLEAAADILSSSWQRRISKVKIPEFGTAISMPIKRRQTLIQDQKLTDYHWWLTT